jgi:hypothetical protein
MHAQERERLIDHLPTCMTSLCATQTQRGALPRFPETPEPLLSGCRTGT